MFMFEYSYTSFTEVFCSGTCGESHLSQVLTFCLSSAIAEHVFSSTSPGNDVQTDH